MGPAAQIANRLPLDFPDDVSIRISHDRTRRKNRPPAATLAETLEALPQPEIRRVALGHGFGSAPGQTR